MYYGSSNQFTIIWHCHPTVGIHPKQYDDFIFLAMESWESSRHLLRDSTMALSFCEEYLINLHQFGFFAETAFLV